MSSHLPFLNKSVPSILANGLLRVSDFLQVGTQLLAEMKGLCLSSANKSIGGTLARTNTVLVETVLYAKTILSATDLGAENRSLWITWFCRALAQTGAAQSSFECTTLTTSLLFASLDPRMLGISRTKFAPHWMALAVAIFRCSPKLSLRSNCTPRYLMLVFHSTSFSLRTILGYSYQSLSCICGDVNHSLDSVHSGRAFPESELVFRETFVPGQESLKPL